MPTETVETPGASVDLTLLDDVARNAKGARSWAEVARRSGLQATSISHLFSGRVRLSEVKLGTMAKLCAALGVEMGELLRIDAGPKALRVRTDRHITNDEFAAAVHDIVEAVPPTDWIGPTEEDLDEVTPAQFAARLRQRHAASRKSTEAGGE